MIFDTKEMFGVINSSVRILEGRWLEKALCATDRSIDTELFFDESRESQTRAIMICFSCPVMQACLTDSLKIHVGGIRGGTTELERRKFDMAKLQNILMLRHESLRIFLEKKPLSPLKTHKNQLPRMFFS